MRILLFMLILLPLLGKAQEASLFKIVSQHGAVLLDGDSTHCGQAVTSKNQKLEISGSGSYVIVLTEAGYAFKLKRGEYTTERIFKTKRSNLMEIKKDQREREAPVREQVDDITVMNIDNEYADALNNSLTLIWKSRKPVESGYTVHIVSVLDELLYDSIVNSNVLTIDVSQAFKTESAVLFDIRTKNSSSHQHLIKKISDQDKRNAMQDFDCVSEMESNENTLLLLALCEVHNLYYDQIHYLYTLWQQEKESGVKINHPYYQRLLREYDFESYFKPVSKSN